VKSLPKHTTQKATMHTIASLHTLLTTHRDGVEDPTSRAAYARPITMLDEAPTTPTGTMKAWMEAHHGMKVDTLQVQGERNVWAPAARTVDATNRAGCVFLDGSAREYRGCRVVGADENSLVVTSDPDGFAALIVYRVTGK
jgi:hypothetical protein